MKPLVKILLTVLFAAVMSLVAYAWTGMAKDVEDNEKQIKKVEEVVNEIRIYQEADKQSQDLQNRVLIEILKEIKNNNDNQ